MDQKDLRRKGVLSRPYPENLLCLLFEDNEVPVLNKDREQGLFYAISRLPEIQQKCILYIFEKNMTYMEISNILSISKNRISVNKGYAIETLSKGLLLNYIRYGFSVQSSREQNGYGQFRLDVFSTPIKELSISQPLIQSLHRHNVFNIKDLVQIAQSTDVLFLEELGLRKKEILIKQVLIPLNDYLVKNGYTELLPENLSANNNTNYYRDMKKDENLIKKFDSNH